MWERETHFTFCNEPRFSLIAVGDDAHCLDTRHIDTILLKKKYKRVSSKQLWLMSSTSAI